MLPDLLASNLRIVFCGTAIGHQSAAQGEYYAGRGNKFWDILHKVGLTPTVMTSGQYRDLLEYGIGLTDCAKNQSGNDKDIDFSNVDAQGCERKILEYQPCVLAFNAKKAAKECLGLKEVEYGLQSGLSIGKTHVFVLPSTSGAARQYWNENWWFQMIEWANANCPAYD